MSNNKQSSIDFIHGSLIKYLAFEDVKSVKIFDDIIEQAKAMHKSEMVDFAYTHTDWTNPIQDIVKDYNETFGGNNEQQ